MKRFYLLFLILTVFLNCSHVKPELMPDQNLAAAVRAELGLDPNEPIFEKHLRELKRLFAMHSGIKDLTGLEKATNLQMLYLDGNKIANITPLARLTQLKALGLKHNHIRDIAPLTKLTELNSLDLTNTGIDNIIPLAGLTQLMQLELSRNEISDITPLTKLTKLNTLKLSDVTTLSPPNRLKLDNEIDDITPLIGLKQLTELELQRHQMSDATQIFSLLAELPKLTKLKLRLNRIGDITPITRLTQLRSLVLDSNQIVDITLFTEMAQLASLSLRNCQITNLTELTNLTRLGFGGNQIEDLTSFASLLVGLTKLGRYNCHDYLFLDDSQITFDITPLASSPSLSN